MGIAKEIYVDNFKAGEDPYRFRWKHFLLMSLLWTAVGTGIGLAVDRGADGVDLWGEDDPEDMYGRSQRLYTNRLRY